jgi:hypothetical protein
MSMDVGLPKRLLEKAPFDFRYQPEEARSPSPKEDGFFYES